MTFISDSKALRKRIRHVLRDAFVRPSRHQRSAQAASSATPVTQALDAATARSEGTRPAESELGVACRFPLGHYYSPLPDSREIAAEPVRSRVWPTQPRATVGIDWNVDCQLDLCARFAEQERLAFVDTSENEREYVTSNGQYPPLDAWLLEAFLRTFRPTRVVEVGSGFSSLVTARVNRESRASGMEFTCIEPYPRSFLTDGVPGITELREEKVQDAPIELFTSLECNDVLFVDTSHTVKTGGDVPWIYHEILPRLRPGVLVHIHDVFLPGDYPQAWVLEGWGWNELYLVQSFLTFNAGFEIMLGARWMIQNELGALYRAFPGFSHHLARGGAALWLRRC